MIGRTQWRRIKKYKAAGKLVSSLVAHWSKVCHIKTARATLIIMFVKSDDNHSVRRCGKKQLVVAIFRQHIFR